MHELENPLQDLWQDRRTPILEVDPAMDEDIKWVAPTFIYQGKLATYNPRAKQFVNLTLPTGLLIDNPRDVLEGDAKEASVFRAATSEEPKQKMSGLYKVVRNWIKLKDK